MFYKNKLIISLMFFSLISVGWGQWDIVPPELTNLSMSPLTLDVSESNQSLTVNYSVIDNYDISGYFFIKIKSPSESDQVYDSDSISEESTIEHIGEYDITIPSGVEPGIWTVNQVYVEDNSGNGIYYYEDDLIEMGLQTEIEVINNSEFDIVPPELTNLSMSPLTLDVSESNQSLTVNYSVIDNYDISGYFFIKIKSPSESDQVYDSDSISEESTIEHIGEYDITIPSGVEPGIWTVNQVYVEDNSGNGIYYYEDDLIEMGLQTEIFVTYEEPSLCNEETEVELWGECYNIEETTSLDLFNDGLTGEIPPEIGNLTNLTYLNLGNNDLTGEISPEIGNLTNLTFLDLRGNQLTGEIPPEIGELINLTYLSLGLNELTGEIPPEIGNLINLTILEVGDSQLSGDIPSSIWNLTNLTELYLYGNQLIGEISPEIGNLMNLDWLYLYDNQLTGEIPSEIGNITGLTNLYLQSNQLSGEIPSGICNLPSWWMLDISNNRLCPPYPDCISEEEIGYQDTSECEQCSENQGDLNSDTEVNIYDIIIMVNCILNYNCDECSDINEDGSSDIFDIINLVNLVLGQ
ncbi:hypothetical protein OAI93_03165 [bacterium]|nr:hypothetical protein [bacterium]